MRLALLSLLLVPALAAQETAFPPGWRVRPDNPAAKVDSLSFVSMEPGWHITTGPSVILWDPGRSATGQFRIQAEIFFFRGQSRDTEAYGVLFGGKNLDQDSQEYLYFVIRNDGKYLVKHRLGGETHTITDWTAHPAIVRHTGEGGPTVKNVLGVAAAADSVRLFANGQQLSAYPADHMRADGLVGLRVNHGLNLHVSRLEIR